MGALARLVESGPFQAFSVGVILLAALVVGLETYPEVLRALPWLPALNTFVLGFFILEASLRFLATWPRAGRYFADGWNLFDLLVIAASFLPETGPYAPVARVLRLLRVLRLVRFLRELQIILLALARAIPAMGYVILLLFLHFYVFAVAGVFLFRENDPVHFANLHTALLTLFRVMTLEDWTDVMYTQIYGCDRYGFGFAEELCTSPRAMPWAALYFVVFVLLGTVIFLNLFIGIIVNTMDEIRRRHQEFPPPNPKEAELARLEADLETLKERVRRLREGA
ncbi:ion transporter [Thermus thermamylovorans]|uniref:Ion transporter n=1 Tax=Thermus thermamylovorans TaxID=2509362 RepID=A0A4V2IVB0_9DEIN|nr:ion transporter [Thermus thermamylovorans]TBH21680.1 ion transporter [Thermus thermamylovorans]